MYGKTIPRPRAGFLNGNAYATVPSDKGIEGLPLYDFTTEVLGYLSEGNDEVLLLQPGGGKTVAQALGHRAKRVVVIEPHDEIATLWRQNAKLGPLGHPTVQLIHGYPRAFLAKGDGLFDLIRFPTVGTFGGTVGLYALSEQFLFTREAFATAWQRLGRLVVTSWMEDYPRKTP